MLQERLDVPVLKIELSQAPELRQPYLQAISEARQGRTVVSFFMSFYTRTPLMPEDADQIEEILCNANIKTGITLLLDAPGGDGLTAERIIKICKSYSRGDFETIVPARAKSAATGLAEHIAVNALQRGMLMGKSDQQAVHDLYVRSKYVVDATDSDKLIETLEASYESAI